MAICGRGHEIRGPHDTVGDGTTCKACHRDNQARYAKRRKAAMAIFHAAEERGLGVGETIALIRNADYSILQASQSTGF